MLASSDLTPGSSGELPVVLCCGVDSLDVNVYIRWPSSMWATFASQMEDLKQQSSGTDGIRCAFAECLILPSGKPMYAWHLQWPDIHVYLQRARVPSAGNGNGYVSVGARLLWKRAGIAGAAAEVARRIQELGGEIQGFKISRCDLAADLQLSGPLCESYLNRCAVPPNLKNNAHRSGDRLETIYYGAKKSPIRLRIYDKCLELLSEPDKAWMAEIWKLDAPVNVWRFEYQLRREFLKSVGIDSFEDLTQRLAGIWKYLTESSFSLRTPDQQNVTRRAFEPVWQVVQSAGARLGTPQPVVRERSRSTASVEWYQSRLSSLVAGLASVSDFDGLEEGLDLALSMIRSYWTGKDFEEEVHVRRLKKGMVPVRENKERSA